MRIIYYDLETTGLSPVSGSDSVEIVQIGATSTYRGSQNSFACHLVPTVAIEPNAKKVHGLTNRHLENMLQRGEAFHQKRGLAKFVSYINEIIDEDHEGLVVLVAHNNFNFDFPILESNLINFGVNFPESSVDLYDSMNLMRRVKATDLNMTSISLDACLGHFFDDYQAVPHNAVHDANDVRRISEEGAKRLGYGCGLRHFLKDDYNLTKAWV